MKPAKIAPTTCAAMYGSRSRVGKRPPAHSPKLTAGLKCAPDTWPKA